MKMQIFRYAPLIFLTIWAWWIFFDRGLEAGPEHWRFYASLFGLIGFSGMLIVAAAQAYRRFRAKQVEEG